MSTKTKRNHCRLFSLKDRRQILKYLITNPKCTDDELKTKFKMNDTKVKFFRLHYNTTRKCIDRYKYDLLYTENFRAEHPNLERALFAELIKNKHADITFKHIRKTALRLYDEMYPNTNKRFCASSTWVKKFRQRYNIQWGSKYDDLSANKHVMSDFCIQFKSIYNTMGLELSQLYALELTTLHTRKIPTDHLNLKLNQYLNTIDTSDSESTSTFENSQNDYVTILTAVNYTGTHRITPLIIANGLQLTSNATLVENGPIYYNFTHHAVLKAQILFEWFQKIFVPEVSFSDDACKFISFNHVFFISSFVVIGSTFL